MTKMLLPDVNFWLALTFRAHVHHPSALAWFNGLSDEICYFCRLTQQGFLRLANNPKAFPADAVSVAEAWMLYDTTLTDPRVSFAIEPAGLEAPGGNSPKASSSLPNFGTTLSWLHSRRSADLKS